MTCQLPSDCLNEIFEYLEADKLTLHSCLLVNRLWCEISVRILWKNIWNFKSSFQQHDTLRIESSIISTLFACLPDESKELLHKNKIFISTPTSKQPLFNYAAFFRALSICEINRMVDNAFKDKPLISPLSLKDRNYLVMNEMIKMFASQIYSLKKLSYRYYYNINFSFPYFPGVKDLSELYCSSNLPSSFFHQLSKVCHNIQTLSIDFQDHDASNELKEMISLQNNLKNLTLSTFDVSWENIIPALKNHSNITKLYLYGNFDNLPFSFVSLFPNLQEFIFSFLGGEDFENFRTLQYVNFSKLQTLKIPYQCPKPEYIIKFLENNGKNLKKFHISESDKAFNLSIAKFCPNLKNLSAIFNNGESDVLKTIFINCQQLESIKIWCGEGLLTEKEIFEIVANYSPNNFCELKIFNESYTGISSEDLECFFISWKNRIPKKLLTLINIKDDYTYDLDDFEENRKIIEKYENLGIIKFRTIEYEEEEKGEFYYY